MKLSLESTLCTLSIRERALLRSLHLEATLVPKEEVEFKGQGITQAARTS